MPIIKQQKLLRIYQITQGYCYNSDSLFLWNFIMPHLHNGDKVLEIGSGSGIIGLLCARDKHITLYQVEKQKEYALLNVKNAQVNNINSRVFHADCLDLLESQNFLQDYNRSLLHYNSNQAFDSIPSQHYFDCIIANPPFYATQTFPSCNRFKNIAKQSSYLPLESFVFFVKKMLKPNGTLLFCYAPSMITKVLDILKQHRFALHSLRLVYPRIDKNASLILICAKINSNPQTIILPPLITHIGIHQKDNSREVQDIYNKAMTYSIKVNYNDIMWDTLLYPSNP